MLNAQIDPNTLREFEQALRATNKFTRRNAAGSVLKGALKVAESARSISRPRKSQRRMLRNPVFFRKSTWRDGGPQKTIYPYWIEVLRQGRKAPGFVGSFSLDDPRRRIENRGLAKNVWNSMAGKLGGKSVKTTGNSRVNLSRLAYVRLRLKQLDPEVLLVNRLTYLEEAYPGITNEAMRRGAKALFRDLERSLGRDVRSIWR
jgi:hypothetical protein